MQTVLESLEQSYLNTLNLAEETKRNENYDAYAIEESYCALRELTKAIVLLIIQNDNLVPMDKRVYRNIVEKGDDKPFGAFKDSIRREFMNKLYKKGIVFEEIHFKEDFISFHVFDDGEGNPLCKIELDDKTNLVLTQFEAVNLKKILDEHMEEILSFFKRVEAVEE